jgi:hypothetical protein
VNTLQQKDIFTVYYDKDGRRIIRMSPSLNNINFSEIIPNENVNIQDGGFVMKKKREEYRKEKLTDADIINIGDRIIELLKAAPDHKLESPTLYDTISGEFDISIPQFTRVLKSVREERGFNVVRSFEGYASTRKSFLSIVSVPDAFDVDTEISQKEEPVHVEAAKSEESSQNILKSALTFNLKTEDIKLISDNISKFSGTIDPIKWLDDLVQDAIISIMDGRIVNSNFTMTSDIWGKYRSLCGAYKAEGKELDNELMEMLKRFIDREYEHRFIFTQMSDIISKTTDIKILDNLKAMLENRVSDLTTQHSEPMPQSYPNG